RPAATEGADRHRVRRRPRRVQSRRAVHRRARAPAAAASDHAVRRDDALGRGPTDVRAGGVCVRRRGISGAGNREVGPLSPSVNVTHEGLIDLASARLGGRALLASDEFFAPKENLLAPGRGVFIEGKYTDRGKWMDGWETRRRRGPEGGYDWCLIRLGVPGAISAITVDTNHFRGNHPAACSLDAAMLTGSLGGRQLRALDRAFTEVLPRSPLAGHTENEFKVQSGSRYTHVRLKIYPDGGVARLRVWGEARPDWRRIGATRRAIALAAVEHGGLPGGAPPRPPPGEDAGWRELVPRAGLRANARHRLAVARAARVPVTHVRLNIFPDGGVARLRLWGKIVDGV